MLPIREGSTREIRQEFKDRVDAVVNYEHLVGIQRGNETVSYIVPADLGRLLARLPEVRDVAAFRDWLHELNQIRVGGVPVVQPAIVAHFEYVKDQRRENALSLAALEESLPAVRDGRTVALQFGQPGLVRHGMLSLMEEDGRLFLQGTFEAVDPDRKLWLELSNGQVVETFERQGPTYLLKRTPVEGDVDLLFSWLRFEPAPPARRDTKDGGRAA